MLNFWNYKEGLLLSAFFFFGILILFLWRRPQDKKRAFLHALFAAYLSFLFALVSLPIFSLKDPMTWAEVGESVVLEPFSPLVRSLKIGLAYRMAGDLRPLSLFLYNCLGNLLLLMPLALFNRLIFKFRSNLNLFICFLSSLMIEVWQALLNKMTGIHYRIVDINDLILNTVGAAFLILLIALVDHAILLKNKKKSRQKRKIRKKL